MLRHSTLMVMVFTAAAFWGQSSQGSLPTRRQMVEASSNTESLAAANRARAVANKNLVDFGNTLIKLQALLKQMRAKNNEGKDPLAKANLDMWTLMLDQLDKQYAQLRVAALQREDLEARRAALYKQADEKAAQAAKRAKEASKAAAAGSNAGSQTPATPGAMPSTATRPPSSSSPN